MLNTTLISFLMATQPVLGASADQREVIVLILIDAVRADHVSSYGYERATTPTLDQMAAQGTRYTRAYANAPWTRPSTACFLTGLNASRHKTETSKSKLGANITTLAERLRKNGWTTAGFSANGNGGSLAKLEKGFHYFADPTNTYKRGKRGKTYNGLPAGPFLTKKALTYLKESTAKKLFLFLFYVDPHDPYYAPPELEKMFLGDFKGKIRRRALWERDNDYPEEERFSMIAVYDAGIRFADDSVKELFQGMDKLGLRDNAHVMVTSDHGEGFGEHGFYLHAHHFWEEVIHIPLIAAGPKFEKKVDNRVTQTIDIAPTILDIAGIDPTPLPGHSLLRDPPKEQYVISEYNEFGIHRQAIVGPRYKVIWQRPADEAWYLKAAKKKEFFPSVSFDRDVVHVFDLENDPQEKKDLSGAMPEPAKALLKRLKSFVEASPG